ncbi:MAG: response regulator [Ignavibacteriales bacterium]|nr:response regulator [Ignavibacteriales bacterium]
MMNHYVLEVLEDFFKREPGFSVTTCSNATDALETFKCPAFDAIIADYGLPDMDGINLLKEIGRGDFQGFLLSSPVNIVPMLP